MNKFFFIIPGLLMSYFLGGSKTLFLVLLVILLVLLIFDINNPQEYCCRESIKKYIKLNFPLLKANIYPFVALIILLMVSVFCFVGILSGDDKKVSFSITSVSELALAQDEPVSEINKVVSETKPQIDSGDTAWILISSALVMLMTPGLALFYGGMVRRKNILGTLMQCFVSLGLVTLIWVLYGYSLAFAPDVGGIIGNLDWVGLKGVGLQPNSTYGETIPHQAFMVFQMMFAIITPALIAGAFAERFKFKTYLVFVIIWVTLVYLPLAHWVWGGGWLSKLGALDFAGGLVVHISSGVAALAAAIMVGKRKGINGNSVSPHNLVITLIGGAILWFGWFGFNGGSALTSGATATSAFVVTHIATASSALAWMVVEWIYKYRPTALGVISGAVAGLVAITPAAGFVGPLSAILIGFGAGIICYFAINLKNKFGFDDSLDVVGVHGIGGTWGAIATGVFASTAVNASGANGLLFGNPSLLGAQILSVLVSWLYVFILTVLILKVLDMTMGLRVTEVDEVTGLDLSQHGERGYTF